MSESILLNDDGSNNNIHNLKQENIETLLKESKQLLNDIQQNN